MPARYRIRHATERDLEELVEVEKASWADACEPGDMISRDEFAAQLLVTPDWLLVAEDKTEKKLVGYVSSLRREDPEPPYETALGTWHSLTTSGFHGSHQADGTTLFGMSLGVIPERRRRGIGTRLVTETQRRACRAGLRGMYVCARLPGMRDYLATHGSESAGDYFTAKSDDGKPLDPELRFFSRSMRPLALLPDYIRDKQGCDYAALLEWRNPAVLRSEIEEEPWAQETRPRGSPFRHRWTLIHDWELLRLPIDWR